MKRPLSFRELLLALALFLFLTGIAYRFCFYLPLQEELAAVSAQTTALEDQIAQAAGKAARMSAMQEEIEAFLRRPAAEQTEIAPYDNKAQVFDQLNTILQPSEEYRLHFSDPATDEMGTVRRNVSMTFRCTDFSTAKAILQDFTQCPWRCLIPNLAISASSDILTGPIEISATITFLESTKLTP